VISVLELRRCLREHLQPDLHGPADRPLDRLSAVSRSDAAKFPGQHVGGLESAPGRMTGRARARRWVAALIDMINGTAELRNVCCRPDDRGNCLVV